MKENTNYINKKPIISDEELSKTVKELNDFLDSSEPINIDTGPSKFIMRSTPPPNVSEDTIWLLLKKLGKEINPQFTIDEDNFPTYSSIVMWILGNKNMRACDDINPSNKLPVPGDVNKGLFISGPMGTGKTTAAKLAINLLQFGAKFILENKPLFGWVKTRADEIAESYQIIGSTEMPRTASLLLIDDLGTESSISSFMGSNKSPLKTILEYRGDRPRELITIITCNYSITDPEMLDTYGPRVVSRMHEMFNLLRLTGNDRRRKTTIW